MSQDISRYLPLPGTYERCSSGHYYACVRGDEECPTCQQISALQAEVAAVVRCIERVDDPIIPRDGRSLDDWLAQILQVLVMDRGSASIEVERLTVERGELWSQRDAAYATWQPLTQWDNLRKERDMLKLQLASAEQSLEGYESHVEVLKRENEALTLKANRYYEATTIAVRTLARNSTPEQKAWSLNKIRELRA